MKIKTIEIENFQSHKETAFDLHPGVNVIVGPSDVGKSSILRAINWLLTNKPSGESFVSNWDNNGTSIYLGFEDGSIERVRDKKFNGYILNRNQEFKGFGQTVPKEIADFLNVNELNTQSQFDSPFMLSWTPGERGIFLNKIVDLEITDKTIKNIKSNILNDRRNITALEEDITALEEELEEYADLDQFESDLIRLEKTQEEYDGVSKRTTHLARLLAEEKILRGEMDALSHIPKLLVETKEIDRDLLKLDSLQYEIESLKRIINRLKTTTKMCESLKDTANFKRSIDKIDVDIDDYKKTRENVLDLSNRIYKYQSLIDHISIVEGALEKRKKEFHKLMPETCPLCGK